MKQYRATGPFAAISLLSCSLSASAASFELEVAPAFAHSFILANDPGGNAFALGGRARIGIDFDNVGLSVQGFGVSGGSDRPAHSGQDGGLTAWAFMPSLRMHSKGRHQFVAALGLGLGRLVSAQASGEDFAWFRGDTALAAEGALGYRYLADHFAIGVELSVHLFQNINFHSDVGAGPTGSSPTGSPSYVAALLLTFAWRVPVGRQ